MGGLVGRLKTVTVLRPTPPAQPLVAWLKTENGHPLEWTYRFFGDSDYSILQRLTLNRF